MILGAGLFQLPAIRKAIDLGLDVITVDYLADNVGHRFSHQFVNCSTTDRVGVARAAAHYSVDGICTFASDVAIRTVGYVCDQLGLSGVSLNVAETMSMKYRFRSFLKEKGFAYPNFVVVASLDQPTGIAETLRFPVVFKPADSSGSRGMTKIVAPNNHLERAALDHALRFSSSGLVCAEEFVEGTNVGGDGILIDGEFAFLAITHKRVAGFVVTGHSLPTSISSNDQSRVKAALEKCCSALAYTDGPLNFDVIVTPEQIFIIEMSPRNGGNGIPGVIERASGVDVQLATLRFALGLSPQLPEAEQLFVRGVGSWVFGSDCAGVLKSIYPLEKVQGEVPEIYQLFLAKEPGNMVNRFDHGGNLIGYAIFDCETPALYSSIATRINHALKIEIDPED